MERVSRQGNASAVNEQTLIFSRTKTHPLPPPIFLRPRTSPYVPELERGLAAGRGGRDDTASAMHTTAIIIVRRRKEGETTAYKRGGRRLERPGCLASDRTGGEGGFAHAAQWDVLLAGFDFKVVRIH